MGHRIVAPGDFGWQTRPHETGDPARHVAELSDAAGFARTRANVWRYEPGARGRRHVHADQEETFVVLAGTLSMYVGDPAERHDAPTGGLVHIEPGTPLQTVNHADVDLVVTRTALRPTTAPTCSTRPLARSAELDLGR